MTTEPDVNFTSLLPSFIDTVQSPMEVSSFFNVYTPVASPRPLLQMDRVTVYPSPENMVLSMKSVSVIIVTEVSSTWLRTTGSDSTYSISCSSHEANVRTAAAANKIYLKMLFIECNKKWVINYLTTHHPFMFQQSYHLSYNTGSEPSRRRLYVGVKL